MQPLPQYGKNWPKPSKYIGDCLIYIIGEEGGPYFKVGIGHDPEQRRDQLKRSTCLPLLVYWYWDVRPWAVRVEHGAHVLLSHHQAGITQEWFKATISRSALTRLRQADGTLPISIGPRTASDRRTLVEARCVFGEVVQVQCPRSPMMLLSSRRVHRCKVGRQ